MGSLTGKRKKTSHGVMKGTLDSKCIYTCYIHSISDCSIKFGA